jgi:DNA (cytosine-5)-methyltransferase 1
MLTHLDLFSGIGGFTLAAKQVGGITTTQFVEIDPDAQTVLSHHWPQIPIHPDIRDFHCEPGKFDLFTVGFPCTNTSSAGNRTGIKGEHSSLWYEALRLIREGEPKYVVIENPTGLLHRGMGEVLQGLFQSGYNAEWETISASQLGAPHQRERLFIVAYPNGRNEKAEQPIAWANGLREVVQTERATCTFPSFKRGDDGIAYEFSHELDAVPIGVPRSTPGRIRSRYLYGRSVVPACAAIALRRIVYLENFFAKN